jgi:ribosomal protein S9
MLTVGTLVSSATALRLTRAWVELVADRTGPLARHAVNATVRGGDTPTAQAAFRDEMLALARASAEVSWRELRRGVDEYDALTRDGESPDAQPHRPHRVKL